MPVRNEARHIHACLESILANDYPRDLLEILVVDGMSDDGTRAAVEDFARQGAPVRLLDNPQTTTPAALNIGIKNATGELVMRMDAHVLYPPTYVARLVDWQERSGADNVGGTCETIPSGNGPVGRAIAVAMAHPFGVGNSHFRIGVAEPRWVDTVPFGCYRRDVFERIGLFDEELVRNQDDELNHRLLRRGGRILLVPDVTCRYYARDSLAKLWRMFYQYGYFKPLVARKLGGVMTMRQLVPPAFALSLVAGLVAAPVSSLARLGLTALVGTYLTAVLAAAIAATQQRRTLIPGLVCAFPVMHLGYGFGFLSGAVDHLLFAGRTAKKPQGPVPLSR